MKKYFTRFIPGFLRPALIKIYYFPTDVIDKLKDRDRMIPPKSMIFIGGGDFEQIGQEFKGYMIELANLQPNDRVLDVGCGNGRMAVPLTSYLSPSAEYWGFDIVKEGIEWCQSRISTKFSNFHFQRYDIYNKYYNRHGTVQARDFRFPFEDGWFDFVLLTSVFTHMLPPDLENYLSETSRVLRNRGKCLITFFLLNDESENLIRSGRSTLDFKYKVQGCLTNNKKDPEAAIAYDEELITSLFAEYGLEIIQPVYYGSWCKRDSYLTYQDLIIATKSLSS